MAQINIEISIDTQLFEAAEQLAQELHLTRSALYARAIEELIERRRSQQLLDQLNEAYGGSADPEDETLLRGIHRTMRKIGDASE